MPREVIDYYLTRPPMEKRTAQVTQIEQMVGAAAYHVVEWSSGGRIVFERNPLYHGTYPTQGAPGDREGGLLDDAGKPIPFIDVLSYEYIGEDLPMWLGFLSRQYDLSGIPRDVFGSVISPDRNLQDKWAAKGIRLHRFTEPSVFWDAFNMEDPVLKASKSLRQAMNLGFNAEDYIEIIWNGRGKRPTNILPDSFPCHDEAGPSPYSRFDPAAARAKIEAAKQELARAGLLNKDGTFPTLTIDTGGRDELARTIAEFEQRQFERLGLRIRIELNDWPTLQQKVHNKKCQIYSMGWHADYPDPENFLQLFYGPNIEKGTNNTNYRNPEYDALYDRAKVMNDSAERRDLYVKMVRILNEDCPVILMHEPELFQLAYKWVKNQKRHPIGYGMTKYVRIDPVLRRQMGGR
jgi:ABC-type transport system substrate-binding protein